MAEALTLAPLATLAGVRHAFFTRRGGVSTGLYASLNAGLGSADDPAAVGENRARAAAALGIAPRALITAYQVHSAQALIVERPFGAERPRIDALATAVPGLALGVLSADCAPVLLADPLARVAGAAHAGWRGALSGIVEATVAAMESLGAQRGRIAAAVGPCIGPASYEVGAEFEARFVAADRRSRDYFAPAPRADKRLFDLPGFVLDRLEAAGVGIAAWIGRDTLAEERAFFSNRRATRRGEADYGRLLSAIVLEA